MIPKDWFKKPPNVEDIPEGFFVVIADAAFKNGITGTAVVIRTKGKEYSPRTYSARSKGPIHAELTSIKKGLQSLRNIKSDIRYIVVYNDSLYAYYFLKGRWNARRKYIKKVTEDIRDLINELGVKVEFIWTKGKHVRKVDRLAAKKRREEEERKEKQIQERVMKVEMTIIRSRDVKICERNNEFFAISIKDDSSHCYKVSLDPPFCECPWWQERWANKPEKVWKARALPCKHMCALAEYLGVNIFDIFEKQIWRVD